MRILISSLLAAASLAATAADKQLLWGDTHLHTSYSFDAYTNNNFTADPHTAYNYAKGQPVIHPFNRTRVQIGTPLDFLVVSDHAEFLGIIREIHSGEGVDTEELGPIDSFIAWTSAWYLNYRLDEGTALELFRDVLPPPQGVRESAATLALGSSASVFPDMMDVQVDTWRSLTNIADEHNAPGEFTAFIGWEWSSIPGGANLHRVVMTDGDAKQAQQFQPMSLLVSQYPEDLWAWLEETAPAVGANFIAIPHNSNLSKGYMFDDTRLRGTPFDADYIALRMKWEPIAEITQIKGDSETHQALSPDDEFADFEEFPYYLQNTYSEYVVQPGDFIRSALKRGLSMEREFGRNPYQFGVIGSTDAHTGLATAEEDNFWGKMATDSIPENKNTQWEDGEPAPNGWAFSASGLAAVWAEENTRQSILAAMQRRETYATSGPRIALQFFAGPGLDQLDLADGELYRKATARGVPMGGELQATDTSPVFLVLASKDPLDANLDRIQIVKGWLDDNGEQQEKVFDVAWSGERAPGADGRLPPVGDSVDRATGKAANTIGAVQLSAAWRDPQYRPGQSAFYYVRVLQIPTARHSYLDALAMGQEKAGEHPDVIQERAYSSPIWIRPGS
ncbi:MAG: DUF3604 domain-containing protein [Halioglobus sp.]|nr:DUF3604 domain-containing protein [Halioglobus sp.]